MTTDKRKVDVFTAGCLVCSPTVKMVKDLACASCDVRVYDINKGCETDECLDLAKQYNLKTVPAVVVDGKLLACCQTADLVSMEQLPGVGLPL